MKASEYNANRYMSQKQWYALQSTRHAVAWKDQAKRVYFHGRMPFHNPRLLSLVSVDGVPRKRSGIDWRVVMLGAFVFFVLPFVMWWLTR